MPGGVSYHIVRPGRLADNKIGAPTVVTWLENCWW